MLPPYEIQPNVCQSHKNIHFTNIFFSLLYHGNFIRLCVMVLVERFLVSFREYFSRTYGMDIYHFQSFDIRTQTHEHNETIFRLSHFPSYQYKSKVMFHTVNSYSLVYIMCPIFKIDKLDWFGFQKTMSIYNVQYIFFCVLIHYVNVKYFGIYTRTFMGFELKQARGNRKNITNKKNIFPDRNLFFFSFVFLSKLWQFLTLKWLYVCNGVGFIENIIC